MGFLQVPALRRSCLWPSGCLGNETVLTWTELVLEMVLGGRRFLAEEEPCSQAVLCSWAMEGTKRKSLQYTTCIHVCTTLQGGLCNYCSELPRNSGKKNINLSSQEFSLIQTRCQVDCCMAPAYRSKTWLTITFLSLLLLLLTPFKSNILNGKEICFF